MEWWIIGTLIFVYLVLLTGMYLMSARESRALINYALLILLGEDIHTTQRASLIELIRATDAKDASQLGRKTRTAITKLAMRLSDTVLRMNQLAWKLKTDPSVSQVTGINAVMDLLTVESGAGVERVEAEPSRDEIDWQRAPSSRTALSVPNVEAVATIKTNAHRT
jgi:hypothetical protein